MSNLACKKSPVNNYRPHLKDGGKYCFQFVCQSTPQWGGGYPSQVWMVGGEASQPGLDGGGTPARSGWWGGTPARSWWWGVSQPGLDGGGYPVLMVGGSTPARSEWLGVPRVSPRPGLDGGGTPSQVWMVGGTWGNPPPSLDGVPPHHDWMGYPPPWLDEVPPSTSIESTCYMAGGMPLAFMQEDFLVLMFLMGNTCNFEMSHVKIICHHCKIPYCITIIHHKLMGGGSWNWVESPGCVWKLPH